MENNLPVNAEIIESRDDSLVLVAPKFLIYAIQEGELYRNNLVRAVVFNEYEYLNYKKITNHENFSNNNLNSDFNIL